MINRILAADDEPLALKMLVKAIKEASPESEVIDFSKPKALLEYAETNDCSIAFLDINMRGMTGVELAEKLKKRQPQINIVFVTGFGEYTMDAMELHASGYIMKPVSTEKVKRELADLRYRVSEKPKALLNVRCFGDFAVFDAKGKPVRFERAKALEVLAYLVFRKGAMCSMKEIEAVVFEEKPFDEKQLGYLRKIVSTLLSDLRDCGAEGVLIREHNGISLDVSKIECDYFRIQDENNNSLLLFAGEFMTQYSWAEEMTGYIERMVERMKN